MNDRSEMLLGSVQPIDAIIEIGPSHAPIAAKKDGWNTTVVDHASREELVQKYRPHGVDVDRIEEVDYIWKGGLISDAVPREKHGIYQAFIASHVIEHVPDLLAFLNSAATLLHENAVVALAIPDRRFCFDYFQPLTTTGGVLLAAAEGRSLHSPSTAFDHGAYAVSVSGSGAFGQHPANEIKFMHALDHAASLFSTVRSAAHYVDLHAWRFIPSSFELILLELAWLGHTDWRVERITEARGCEFFAWLRRGGQTAARALSADALQDKRMALLKRTLLETKVQIDFLLEGEAPKGITPDGRQRQSEHKTGSSGAQLSVSTFAGVEPAASADAPPAPSTSYGADGEMSIGKPRFVDWGLQVLRARIRPFYRWYRLISAPASVGLTPSADAPLGASATHDTDGEMPIGKPRFVDWSPHPDNAVRLFAGEWSSAVPGVSTGAAHLFDDPRIHWFEEKLGGFDRKQILELGPLEAGHTSMMTQKGAIVRAIEANTHAYLRCLVVKELLGITNAKFVLGDFTKLAVEENNFDFVLASGVLYHMTDPVDLLERCMSVGSAIGIWTHYFDPEVLRTRNDAAGKFMFEPRRVVTKRGRSIGLYEQRYLDALKWKGFCGGSAAGSVWMTRADILAVIEDEGFQTETAFDHAGHPNGPAFCVFARRLDPNPVR